MPGAAHSIPRTSELIPHGLLLWDLGLSYPLWVWLRTQRDLANLGIWAAFLCAQRCPFPHTYRKYPKVLYKTLWATFSNYKLGLAADEIAPPFEGEVHTAWSFYYLQACAGAPRLMLHLRQALDSPQVSWPALAEMCLSAIGKSENPPKYWVVIHCTMVLNGHSDPRCLPIPMRNMAATIYEPSTLLKHPMKCISTQESSVLLALLQCIRDQNGVWSPQVSKQVVSHSQVSILTTSWSSRALQCLSSGVPHPVECVCLQSG